MGPFQLRVGNFPAHFHRLLCAQLRHHPTRVRCQLKSLGTSLSLSGDQSRARDYGHSCAAATPGVFHESQFFAGWLLSVIIPGMVFSFVAGLLPESDPTMVHPLAGVIQLVARRWRTSRPRS